MINLSGTAFIGEANTYYSLTRKNNGMVGRPEDHSNDLEFIQAEVGKYFTVYKTEVQFDVVNLYVRIIEGDDFEDSFDELRRALVPLNFIPFLHREQGEYIISVKKQPERSFRSPKANLVMLILTLCTTLVAGMWWWSSYDPGEPLFSLYNLKNGALFFTLPLMTILGVHEMGHYLMARYHGIKASLPFFMPFLPPLGTIGAFISIREPIPDRKSLLDLGVAGPICGFLVAIPVSIIGLYLGGVMDRAVPIGFEGAAWVINYPPILMFLEWLLPFQTGTTMHPTAFAGWVGFLVTGLNLLPAGQLDGGHILRSLLGESARYASYLAAGFLIVAGILFYSGWLIFAIFLLFFVGLKHPPPLNELGKLDMKRKGVGVIAVVMLLTCFHPIPIGEETFRYDFALELQEAEHQTLGINESAIYTFTITNTGKPREDVYNISFTLEQDSWQGSLSLARYEDNTTYWESIEDYHTRVELSSEENVTVLLKVFPGPDAVSSTEIEFNVESEATGRDKTKSLYAEIDYIFDVGVVGERAKLIEDDSASFEFVISNHGRDDIYNVTVLEVSNRSWYVHFINGRPGEGVNITLEIPSGGYDNFTAVLTTRRAPAQVEFFLGTPPPLTRSGVVLVTATIEITSTGSGASRTIDISGVLLN